MKPDPKKLSREELEILVASQRDTIEELRKLVAFLTKKLKPFTSEKLSLELREKLLGECVATGAEAESEALHEKIEKQSPRPANKKPNQNHPGRNPLPDNLPVEIVTIKCTGTDCACELCGRQKSVLDTVVRKELVIEKRVFIREIHREKCACPACPQMGVTIPPMPPRISPGSQFGDETIVHSIQAKFNDHTPVYRQVAGWLRDYGIDISRQMLTDQLVNCGFLLQGLIPSMLKEITSGGYVQVDETTVPCQDRQECPGKNHQAYMWQYSRPLGVVVYVFQMGRGADGPMFVLLGFIGFMQTDGYVVYEQVSQMPGIVHVGCMAHARRYFSDLLDKSCPDPDVLEVLGIFGRVYSMEKEAKRRGFDPAKRHQMRQNLSRGVMEELKVKLESIKADVKVPGVKIVKACDYVLKRWELLCRFLDHGQLEIDNNHCEGSMRQIAVGRKNWLHIGSKEVGPAIAAVESVMETCKRLEINTRDYLLDVLPKLAGDWPATGRRVGRGS